LSKAREYHPDKRPECLDFFTHVTKAYEVLSDDHKRANYDDEQIPDEEYFTVTVGGAKINMFTVLSVTAVTLVAFNVAYFSGALSKVFPTDNTRKEGACPIDHTSR